MELFLDRFLKGPDYTVGRLYINGDYVCDTLEDVDRGLTQGMSEKTIRSIKVYGKTAIPQGSYTVTLDVYSPKFGAKRYYQDFCGAHLPRVLNVKGFDGILMHIGNKVEDTCGCILLGYYNENGIVIDSTMAFETVYGILKEGVEKGEKLNLTIS